MYKSFKQVAYFVTYEKITFLEIFREIIVWEND